MNGMDAGLLRFCLEHTDGANLTETVRPERDEADYKWLREALNNLESDAERMKKMLTILRAPDTTLPTKLTILEELQCLTEDIDNANDLHKIHGFERVLELVNDETSPELRYWAAWVVGTSLQNNPWSQAQAMEKGALDQLLLLLQNETEDRVLSKAVPAVSGLIRDNPSGVEAFLKMNGLRLLAYMLSESSTGIKMKSDRLSVQTKMKVVFFLTYLCRVVPLVRHAVREYSLISPLVDLATVPQHQQGGGVDQHENGSEVDLREKALACLIEATNENGLNVEACREAGLFERLARRIGQLSKGDGGGGGGEGEEMKHQTELDLCRALHGQLTAQLQCTDK